MHGPGRVQTALWRTDANRKQATRPHTLSLQMHLSAFAETHYVISLAVVALLKICKIDPFTG